MIVSEEGFDIDAVRRDWIGASLGRSAGRYPVEYAIVKNDDISVGTWRNTVMFHRPAKRGTDA